MAPADGKLRSMVEPVETSLCLGWTTDEFEQESYEELPSICFRPGFNLLDQQTVAEEPGLEPAGHVPSPKPRAEGAAAGGAAAVVYELDLAGVVTAPAAAAADDDDKMPAAPAARKVPTPPPGPASRSPRAPRPPLWQSKPGDRSPLSPPEEITEGVDGRAAAAVLRVRSL